MPGGRRRRSSMRDLNMTVFQPSRRKTWVARWREPTSGRWRQKTLDARIKRDAGEEAGALADSIVSGVDPAALEWKVFCGMYEQQHLAQRSKDSQDSWRTTKRYVEALAPLRTLADASPVWVAKFQAALRRKRLAQNSVATYSARLRAALRWAERQRLIDRAPYVPVEVIEAPRSRAITGEELDRMVAAAEKMRPKHAATWKRFLWAQWESGLRISELLKLSWEADAPVRIVTSGKRPLIYFGQQKNKRRQWGAVTREFWAICCQTPEDDPSGLVFILPGADGQLTVKRAVETIAKFGKRARIVTNPETGKTATSHDLRRALPIRLQEQGKLNMAEIQKVMRHSKLETTLTYYDTRTAEDISAKLWETQKEIDDGTHN